MSNDMEPPKGKAYADFKRWVKRTGLTQNEIGERLGVNRVTVAKWCADGIASLLVIGGCRNLSLELESEELKAFDADVKKRREEITARHLDARLALDDFDDTLG